MTTRKATVIHAGEGRSLHAGGSGTDFKLWSDDTGGLLSIVEHPIDPGVLVPPHVHSREDQATYVIEGSVDILVGETVTRCPTGTYVFKPRGVQHTFWNPGSSPARLIEISTPAGIERYMESLFEILTSGQVDPAAIAALAKTYGLTLLPDLGTELAARHNLRLMGRPLP
jgi:quercetin dioxygenase-like cupin family protein